MPPVKERLQITPIPSYSYLLPDGLDCYWLYPSSLLSYDQLRAQGDASAKQVANTGQEIRICHDSASQIASLSWYLKGKYPNVDINWGKTTYFEYDLTNQPLLDWQDYSSEFTFYRVTHHMKQDLEIFKMFMLNSFGTTQAKCKNIEMNFAISSRDISNNFYMVKNGNQFVGCFVTKYLPALEEVQLHCVAGRGGKHPEVSQEHPKLPVLMAALFQSIADDYPRQSIGPDGFVLNYSAPTRLTFSSLGAADLYMDLGFKKSKRDGIVISKERS